MFSSFNFVNAVKNPLQKIKSSFKQLIAKQKVQLTPIIPQKLYHISTPTEGNIQSLLQEFKTANQFQLWNISEYSYGEQILAKLLDGRQRNSDGRQIVYNLTYQYFASIPFCQMIKSIETIETFISLNPKNKVYIHCQQNKRRSAIFLACYIFLTGIQTDIVTSILKVNKILNISMQEKEVSQNSPGSIYKSQHIVLKNLMNYINNSAFINKNAWNLKKILINNAPKIHDVLRSIQSNEKKQQIIKFKVLLEIRSVEGVAYKKIFHDQFIQGESLCLRLPQTEKIVLKDDFVLIIKYVHDKKGYSILRAQLNTNFIYDQYCRVQRNDMDLSINNAHSKNDTIFMDLLLESNPNQLSQLSKLNILKESEQNEIVPMINQSKNKENLLTKNTQQSSQQQKHSQQQDEDGFGILDEEQEAVHNQKMQRQIEQQLAKQLEKIRKKKNQQQEKIIEDEQKAKQDSNALITTEIKQKKGNIPSQNIQNSQQKQKDLPPSVSEQQSRQNQVQNLQINEKLQQQPQNQQKNSENKEQPVQHPSSQDQQESSSQKQSSSSEEQEQQEEQDLDDYLSKLQKQAQRHD